jgi:propionyl-CoA carboxylase alpha chain
VVEGGEVSLFYDPMIAKLCASGPDRAAATARLRLALDAFVIRGPAHNVPFLASVLARPRFAQGRLSTGFIAEEYGERFGGEPLPDARSATSRRWRSRCGRGRRPARRGSAAGCRGGPTGRRPTGRSSSTARPSRPPSSGPEVELDGGPPARVELDWRPGQPLARARVDGRPLVLQADPVPEGWRLTHGGAELRALVRTRRASEYAARMPPKAPPDTSRLVRSPMPGLILAVAVAPGQEVKAGQELCVLEAMKMENVLRAERDGTVAEVGVAPRDTVAADQVLLTFV